MVGQIADLISVVGVSGSLFTLVTLSKFGQVTVIVSLPVVPTVSLKLECSGLRKVIRTSCDRRPWIRQIRPWVSKIHPTPSTHPRTHSQAPSQSWSCNRGWCRHVCRIPWLPPFAQSRRLCATTHVSCRRHFCRRRREGCVHRRSIRLQSRSVIMRDGPEHV